MRVLITGASGLIGRHTVEALLEHGHVVRAFQRTVLDSVESIQGDVRNDHAALCRAASDCDALVHLAGRGDVGESRRDPVGYAELHASGTLHALDAARATGAVFVLASTQRVYPLQAHPCREDQPLAPDSPYGYAKWVAELWCRMASEHLSTSTRVLRFFSVYGPGQQANGGSGVVSIFARAALAGEPLVVQSAGRRDFTDVRDVAWGILRAIDDAQRKGGYRVYNVATGKGTSFGELARSVVRLSGSSSEIREHINETEGCDLVADTRLAAKELQYASTIELENGLSHYITWLKQQSSC